MGGNIQDGYSVQVVQGKTLRDLHIGIGNDIPCSPPQPIQVPDAYARLYQPYGKLTKECQQWTFFAMLFIFLEEGLLFVREVC